MFLVIFFFLVWRMSLSYLLWSGRSTPPVTDDSYVYLSNIESVRTCPTLIFCSDNLYSLNAAQAYDRLAYRLPLGMFAQLLGISSLEIFKLSFFFGNLFLLMSVYVLLTALRPPKLIKVLCLLSLAFFHGNGLYHGFYWLVPSAYALGLFFLSLAIIIRPTKNAFVYLLVFIPIGIYTHLIYLYLLMVPLTYSLTLSFLNRKIQHSQLFKSLLALLIAAISYFPVDFYLQKVSKGYSYGVINSYQNVLASKSTLSVTRASLRESSQIFQSLDQINLYYFKQIFSVPIIGIAFLFLIGILAVRQRNRILSLYFSCLVFTLVSSLSLFGYRSLIILWPVTLILMTFGIWEYIFNFLKFKFAAFMTTLVFLGLISLFGAHSIFLTLIFNQDHVWDVDDRAVAYIQENIPPKTPVYYGGKIPESFIGSNSLYTRLNRTLDPKAACYYFAGFPNPKTDYTRLDQALSLISLKLNQSPTPRFPEKIDDFTHDSQFGSLHIYKKNPCPI